MRIKMNMLCNRIIALIMLLSLILPYTYTGVSAAESADDPVIVVSMGDSFSSGEGIPPFYGQEKSLEQKIQDENWLAHRSIFSWGGQIEIPGIPGTMSNYFVDYHGKGSTAQWYFVASSGAVTADFNHPQTKTAKKAYGFLDLMYYQYEKDLDPQLKVFDKIDGDVDYVTFSIGGNDVDFAGVVKKCAMRSSYLMPGFIGESIDKKLNDLWNNIDNTMLHINKVYVDTLHAAGPQATVIVAGYPELLDYNGKGFLISKHEAEAVNKKVNAFNDKLMEEVGKLQTEGYPIEFVDVRTKFATHQAYSRDPWINPINFISESEDLIDFDVNPADGAASAYSMHPNEDGAAAYAECVNEKIAEIEARKNSGTLAGRICMASDRTTPVTNAAVTIDTNDMCILARPDSNGDYSTSLPVGRHSVKVTAPGFIEFNAYATIQKDETEYMETFLMVQGDESDIGTAQGNITNALSGAGIEDVTLDVRKGWNNTDQSEILTTITTDGTGMYTVTLPIGNYTLCASKPGFAPTTVNIVVQANCCTMKHGSMTPVVSGDNFRIVLTWGENPRDLDSHVVGSLSGGESFHVFYQHMSQYDGNTEVCNLDIDDTTSFGPETITLNATTDYPYYYYIYRYAGSGTVASSGAQVKVYQGENLVATFNVPTNLGSGDYWNVFAIVNGQLIVRNTMTDAAETSYATASRARFMSLDLFGPDAHPVYDDRYPAKEEIDDATIDLDTPENKEDTTEPDTIDPSSPFEGKEETDSPDIDDSLGTAALPEETTDSIVEELPSPTEDPVELEKESNELEDEPDELEEEKTEE